MNDLISNISRLTTAIRQSEKTLMELGKAFEEVISKVVEVIRSEVQDEELKARIIQRIKDELQN